MRTALKIAAVLFVGLPLWFLAWRGYDEWRVASAWREYRDNIRSQAAFQDKEPPDAKAVYDRAKKLLEQHGDEWQRRGFPHPSILVTTPWMYR